MSKFVSIDKLQRFLTKIKNSTVSKSGDTMTGDLTVGSSLIHTNGYIQGTWLKTTASNHTSTSTGKIAVLDGGGWIYYRTADEIRTDISAAETASYVFTIGTSWSSSSAPYTQTIYNLSVTSEDDPIIDIIPSTTNYEKQLEEWNKVFKITTSNNSLTIYASEKTTISLTCQMKVVR